MEPDATRDRIAEAALAILEAEGAEKVSMRRGAGADGITARAIHHHFRNREALLTAVTDREFAKLRGYIDKEPHRGSIESRIIKAMEAYIDYAFDRPRIFDYVFAQPREGARTYPADFRARRSPTLNPIADVLRAGMKAGVLKKDDVWEVAMELWAHIHGYLALHRAGRFNLLESEFRALMRRSLRRLIHGLKA
jgi:AcrR family transcriptional regulator